MSIRKKYADEVCYLELNRPDKKNALNREMLVELISFLETSVKSADYKVLVILGRKEFLSSGADLDWMRSGIEQSFEENLEDARLFNRFYHLLDKFPKPVIVRADMGAYGGAVGIAACADIVISAPDARFMFSEVTLGLVPATVAPYIVKKVGMANARYLLLSGLPFSGEEAFTYNLVQKVFPLDKIEEKTIEIASHIAGNSGQSLFQTKLLMNRLSDQLVQIDKEIQDLCATMISELRISPESQKRVRAFLEKRKGKNE